ncbi:MAG TPA: hypothetical protein VFB28_13205 [Terriglobales bacterium]|nr:hypothetical protein [Terriglobales bacterium]
MLHRPLLRFRYTNAMKYFDRLSLSLAALLLVAMALPQAFGDEGPLDKSEPKGITSDEIIQRFAAKEKEFKEAYDLYGYRETAKMQTLDGDTPDGEFQETFDVSFDDKGHRVKNVVFAPLPSLQRITMSREDYDDLENGFPMVLTSDEIAQYNIIYAGQQQEDELHCYVFDVAPKQIEKNKRYFQGRIWVDDHDFQIVKTYGQMVPETRVNKKGKGQENLFPKFTTWREQIDGKYWFPTYTRADDTLHFSNQDVKIREIVKYTNYKRFGSNVKITYQGKEIPKGGDQKDNPPQQPQ